MKKYYLITSVAWGLLTLLCLGVAIYRYTQLGSQAWWYFVALGVALLLFLRRLRLLKKEPALPKNRTETEN